MLGFKFRCIWFVKDSHSAYQTVHQLTCSLFQVTNFDSIPYQIPVGSDRFTVILVPATLSTMQVSDDSEFSGAAFLNPKIQNILFSLFRGIICYSQHSHSSGFSGIVDLLFMT